MGTQELRLSESLSSSEHNARNSRHLDLSHSPTRSNCCDHGFKERMFRVEELMRTLVQGRQDSSQGPLHGVVPVLVKIRRIHVLSLFPHKEPVPGTSAHHHHHTQVGFVGHGHEHQQVAQEHLDHVQGHLHQGTSPQQLLPGTPGYLGMGPWIGICWF